MSDAPMFRAVASRHAAPPGTKTLTVQGVECEIVDDERAEEADFVICIPAYPALYAGSITGKCRDCPTQLQWRPHAPKKPPRICRPCFDRLCSNQAMEETS